MTQRLSKTKPELQGGGGNSKKLLVTLATLVPFSQVDSDTDTYGQVHRTATHLPNFQQLHLCGVGEGPTVIPSSVGWVAVGGVLSLGLESLGITLVVSPIHHART